MLSLSLVVIAMVAVSAWVLSYRRSTQPRRNPDLFVALSQLNDRSGSSGPWRAAEVIDEKHHLETRAAWPSAVVGALSVGAAVLIVQDPSNMIAGAGLRWMTGELLVIALISAVWTGWCVHRAARLVVGQADLHRGLPR
ncbi:hypothetical protein ABLE94_12065 [Gordonia sp. VNK1]|uniref:hypothetical protein n=1 Tax=Gordonia oleivorans TaxID=3156618 RepID=UPI0032B43651